MCYTTWISCDGQTLMKKQREHLKPKIEIIFVSRSRNISRITQHSKDAAKGPAPMAIL